MFFKGLKAFLNVSDLYLKNADWEKVVSECERAIKIDGKSIAAYKMLGVVYYNMHNYEHSLQNNNNHPA